MEELIKKANDSYLLAEQKAAQYFDLLHDEFVKKSFVSTLTKDIQSWKSNHINHRHALISFFSSEKRNSSTLGYHGYIQWLNRTDKLDKYLDRSISYIYMRDLGKDLDSSFTQDRVRNVVEDLKDHLTNDRGENTEIFSMAGLYRWAQKEGVESSILWVINKLKTVAFNIPNGMDAEHAQRKLIKTLGGVVMHAFEEMDDETSAEERTKKLDEAIKLGYSYGLTYPFIDDLLDANVLSVEEKEKYSNFIRTTLITGSVSDLGEWTGRNANLIHFIHGELVEAFEYIKEHQQPETVESFLEQSYVFFHSQEVDRLKKLSNAHYTNEDLYIPIILKSSSSRLIVRSIINAPKDKGFEDRTFFYGIYNQLSDDFTDMFDDMKEESVTPYTYYMKFHDSRPDLINPFELYWTVISYLVHDVYHSDIKTCEVILDRVINGLKRFKEKMGAKKYKEVMEMFSFGNSKLNRLIQRMVRKADDVDFLDKLMRDHIVTILRNEQRDKEEFLSVVENVREKVNNILYISKSEDESLSSDPIMNAANYSLEGDGKRLRPIVTWVIGVKEYGLNSSVIAPLLRSLEYMHTASLIFDDLPAQDNASVRRGRPTLHQVYNIAIAELTGLYLTQKATWEQTTLEQFDSKNVLKLIEYSSRVAAEMCKGQAMDLESKGVPLSIEQLNSMCFYKTGLGFEASLIMPAILAEASDEEMKALKKFAYHAGIAFQIKDDLLDLEGDLRTLGKAIGKDTENNNSTFVSILGSEGAKKEMWEHYCLAIEALQGIQLKTTFLKHFLNYIVNRNH
ncbi:polyprenyl synthetase family protein [Aquibacillus rhizosphaerae]|uniref:Polyprenyl synthetase family protein n=1 Tax=Aquibacillus rhizosphaerae TaxID=3051431 RepID=A0ABT7L7D7_9BACI|nr:polyprenyl synthetase family protein [Aquibacillus sp. LR5S19]MDL4841778.1 polyprenyl synthetase family protein [Aquibacillus sp. LR5S19]